MPQGLTPPADEIGKPPKRGTPLADRNLGPKAPKPAHVPGDWTKRAAWVDRQTQGTLPTDAVLAIADLPERQTATAVGKLAAEYSLPIHQMLQPSPDGSAYLAPNGQMISARQARRILRINEPKVLRSMIATAIAKDDTLPTVDGHSVRVKDVSRAVNTLFAGLPQGDLDQMSLTDMLGAAISVADMPKRSRDIFLRNLQTMGEQVVTSQGQTLPWMVRLSIAEQAARKGLSGTALQISGVTDIEQVAPGQSALTRPVRSYGGNWYRWDPVGGKWDEQSAEDVSSLKSAFGTALLDPTEYHSPPGDWSSPSDADVPTFYGGDRVSTPNTMGVSLSWGDDFDPTRPNAYYQQSLDIAQQVKLDQQAFERSPVGKVLKGYDWLKRQVQTGALVTAAYGGNAIRDVGSAFGLNTHAEREFRKTMRIAAQVSDGDTSIGDVVANSTPGPSFVRRGVALFADWETDPLVIASKAARGANLLREINTAAELGPLGKVTDKTFQTLWYNGLLRPTGVTRASVYRGLVNDFADDLVDRSLKWAEAADAGEGGTLYSQANAFYTMNIKAEGISPQLARILQDIYDSGASTDRIRVAMKDAVLSSLGQKAVDPLALRALYLEDARVSPFHSRGASPIREVPVETLRGRMAGWNQDRVRAFADDIPLLGQMTDKGLLLPVSPEIPRYRALTGAIRSNDAAPLEPFRKVFGFMPHPTIGLEGGQYSAQIERYMTQAGVYDRNAISQATTAARELESGIAPARESKMVSTLTSLQRETWDRLVANHHLDPIEADAVYKQVLEEQVGRLNVRNKAYGQQWRLGADGQITSVSDSPQLETQLLNSWSMMLPSEMRRIIRDRLTVRQILSDALKGQPFKLSELEKDASVARGTFIADLPVAQVKRWDDIAEAYVNAGDYETLDDFYTAVASHSDPIETWAKGVPNTLRKVPTEVLRRAKVERVITDAMDLYFRAWKPAMVLRAGYLGKVPLGDEQVRFLADAGIRMRLESTRTWGKVAKALGREETDLLPVVLDDGTVQVLKRKAIGLLPTEEQVATDGVWFENLYAEIKRAERISGGDAQWRTLTPADKRWADSWERAVNGHYGASQPGRIVLEGVANGDSEEKVRMALRTWAKTPEGKQVLSRIDPADTEQWLTSRVSEGFRLTGDNARIATAALDREATADDLLSYARSLAGDGKPRIPDDMLGVHGVDVAEGLGMHKGNAAVQASSDFVASMGRWILSKPTNVLSRQPFFRAWFTKLREGMLQTYKEAGILDGLSKSELSAVESFVTAQARRTAADRTLTIMFDMHQRSRFAELSRFIFPFMQPYSEFISVYTKLLRRNPQLAAYAKLAFAFGKETGLITQNDDGSWQTPINLPGTPQLLQAMVGGGDGWKVNTPLASLNLFVSNYFKIAGIPIPTPGLSPPAQLAMQHFVSDKSTSAFATWLYPYGKTGADELLPIPFFLRQFVAPDEQRVASLATKFIGLADKEGIHFDSEAQAREWANDKARQFLRWRGIVGFMDPGSPAIEWPTQGLQDEWRAIEDKHGDNWQAARDEWFNKHPDMGALITSQLIWQQEDPGLSGTGVEVPRLPATELQTKILNAPGFSDFATRFPALAFALLPDAAWDETGFDRKTFMRDLGTANLKYRDPGELYAKGDAAVGWNIYWHIDDWYSSIQEAHDAGTISDERFDYWTQQKNAAIEKLKTDHWGFAQEFGSGTDYSLDFKVLQYLRTASKQPAFAQMPIGKALGGYLDARDAMKRELASQNINSIDSEVAKNIGLTAQWDKTVQDITDATPGFQRLYDVFHLDKDLNRNFQTEGDIYRAKLFNSPAGAAADSWFKQEESLRSQIPLASGDAKLNLYSQQAALWDEAYRNADLWGVNPAEARWQMMSASDRIRAVSYAVTKPYIYLNRFEREQILHEPTTDAAEQIWLNIRQMNTAITQNASTPGFNATTARAQRDSYIRAAAQQDPVFALQLQHANTWGWSFFTQDKYTAQTGPAGEAWQATKDELAQAQAIAPRLNAQQYAAFREDFYSRIQQRMQISPSFASQWNALEQANGADDFLDELFPPYYAPLGGK